jgi:hypothetical protein
MSRRCDQVSPRRRDHHKLTHPEVVLRAKPPNGGRQILRCILIDPLRFLVVSFREKSQTKCLLT